MSEGVDISKNIENMKRQIEAYEAKGCKREQDITTCTAMINAYGWSYPLDRGCVTSEYTGFNLRTDWSGGGGHHAIDLDCVSEGVNVYPAADGVVKLITSYPTCGGNTIYILHNVNGKVYTTVYMHLLRFASGLRENQIVTTGTVIGYVGGYSTSSAHGGTDNCTTGTHLHFGIAEGDSAYKFNSYSINPREIFNFPKLVYSGGGYFYR